MAKAKKDSFLKTNDDVAVEGNINIEQESIKNKFDDEFPDVPPNEVMVDDVIIENESTIKELEEIEKGKSKKEKHKKDEEQRITEALVLKDFGIHIPMPNQNVNTIVNFYKDRKITDPYILSFLKTGSYPVKFI